MEEWVVGELGLVSVSGMIIPARVRTLVHDGHAILGDIGCGRGCGIGGILYVVACATSGCVSRCGHVG